jgi:DNA recombination protein RmuC
MQLRRVVELAGMADHCDFTEQPSEQVEDGRVRPDLVVHLPMGKNVIVDAKVPLDAYLRALEAPDEQTQRALLREHAQQVRAHMTKLAGKSYWQHVDDTPDHVVMFIPGEVFFFAALQHDPELIEFGVGKNVFVAGPATLISLLRSVAYGWRQERIAENAQAISQNGQELYERVATLADHLRKLGAALDRSVESYNQAIGSLESRVLVSARKFKELGATNADEIDAVDGVERSARQLVAPELRSPPSERSDDAAPEGVMGHTPDGASASQQD